MKDPVFVGLLTTFYVILLVLYSVGVRYGSIAQEEQDAAVDPVTGNQHASTSVETYYDMFIDVSVMIFIGFGFLMTFLKKYGYSAVGYNFLLSCLSVLWGILCLGFWNHVHALDKDYRIQLTMPLLTEGLFVAATVMISFGAVLGRTSPAQLLVLTFVEVMAYSLNYYLGVNVLNINDSGGSVRIHVFGAYFGLSVSWIMEKMRMRYVQVDDDAEIAAEAASKKSSRTTSDITAMIGTIFLWIMWPSFNAALATPSGRLYAITNTFLSLCSSVVGTFIVSKIVSSKFEMFHVQNATLAGGVAMGAAANLYLEPGGAIGIGAFAGIVSVLGFKYVMPYLEKRIGLLDTCGVHNLHGMPGLIGGIVTIIGVAATRDYHYAGYLPSVLANRTAQFQSHYQVYYVLHTIGIAVVTGLFTGSILEGLFPASSKLEKKNWYGDDGHWEVQADFGPEASQGHAHAEVVEERSPEVA